MRHPDQIEIQNAIRTAFLDIVPVGIPGLTVAQIQELIKSRFPREANVSGWARTVQLDLEAKGIVARERSSPIRLYRIPAS